MGKFHDLTNSLGVGEDGVSPLYPDTFLSDISGAYDEDMGLANAAVEVARADHATALAEIAALKAHNYDLMMQTPSAPDENGGTVDESSEPDESEEEDNRSGMDMIFSEKDKD